MRNENERALLGAILNDSDVLIDVISVVSPDSFRGEQNKAVYTAMLELFNSSAPVDLVTVADRANKSVGSAHFSSYCAELMSIEGIQFGQNAMHYAKMVERDHKWYELAKAGTSIVDLSMTQHVDVDEAIDSAEGMIFNIAAETKKETGANLSDLLMPTLNELEAARENEGGVIGISSGFYQVDSITAGFKETDLTIVAARPAMGKSAFSMQLALNAAKKGKKAAFFSLEMGGTQLVQRILTQVAGVDPQRARRGFTNDEDWSRLVRAAGQLDSIPLYIDDDFSMTPTELRAKCRRLKMKQGLDMVVVDYLQLMHVAGMNSGSREREIATISRSLKGLAKELEVPVVALSQLSRAAESRGLSARPQLSDLRESGAIEQDADNVMFIHRPEYYGVVMDESTGRNLTNVAEVIVAKQRSGPTGTAELFFKDGKFSNLDRVAQQ